MVGNVAKLCHLFFYIRRIKSDKEESHFRRRMASSTITSIYGIEHPDALNIIKICNLRPCHISTSIDVNQPPSNIEPKNGVPHPSKACAENGSFIDFIPTSLVPHPQPKFISPIHPQPIEHSPLVHISHLLLNHLQPCPPVVKSFHQHVKTMSAACG